MDVEVLGFYSKRLFEFEVITGVVHDEVEALDDVDDDHLCFLPCEWASLGSLGFSTVQVGMGNEKLPTIHPRMP